MKTSSAKVVPVLDVMHGIVVRGIAGNRDQYQPNQSCLVDTPDPLLTARAFQRVLQNEWLYVADLDGIQQQQPQINLLRELNDTGVKVCIDIGVHSIEEVQQLSQLGCAKIVIALETLPSFEWLAAVIEECGPEQLVFSLDLNAGIPMHDEIQSVQPLQLAQQVIQLGITHLIVLDLASVGTNHGVPTISLCEAIKTSSSTVELWTGGGVRSMEEIDQLSRQGINGVLVASALHDGKLCSP